MEKTKEAFLKELQEEGVIVAFCKPKNSGGKCNAQERDRKDDNGGTGHSYTSC